MELTAEFGKQVRYEKGYELWWQTKYYDIFEPAFTSI